MVSYNPKQWLSFIFNIPKADTVRKLFPWILLLAVYSFGVVWLEKHFLTLTAESHIRNLSIVHTLLGFAISMLLVFRTNTAYDRWWEGRRLWGSLINHSRNFSIKLSAMLPHDDVTNRRFFREVISGFALVLKNHLQLEETQWALDEKHHPELAGLSDELHPPMQMAAAIIQRIQLLQHQGIISGEQLLFLNVESTSLMEVCGACERIRNTPIPYSYSAFIKKFILIYVLTLPVGYVFSLGYLIIPVVLLVFYVLGSLEVIAEEIEEPFGKDSNDLPMQQICDTIKRNVEQLLKLPDVSV